MEQEISRESIMKMEPGREMDALITTKVMCLDQWYTYSEFQKPYSTDITSAWEVIEKLKETNDCVTLAWGQDSWECQVCLFLPASKEWEMNTKESIYDSPSAPEAICKAALLTVLEDKSHD